jgi:2',5'-phosphodiesterase
MFLLFTRKRLQLQVPLIALITTNIIHRVPRQAISLAYTSQYHRLTSNLLSTESVKRIIDSTKPKDYHTFASSTRALSLSSASSNDNTSMSGYEQPGQSGQPVTNLIANDGKEHINESTKGGIDASDHFENIPTRIRVVSYNLLSSHLAQPSHHTKCSPEHLDASNRFPKILVKLQEQMDTHKNDEDIVPVVFCLQEVSHDWAKQLHVFFAERGYHLITALYGKRFNGYMGIATAYPTQHFQTLDVDLCRLSDTRPGGWPRPPIEDHDLTIIPRTLPLRVFNKLFDKFIVNPISQTTQFISSKIYKSTSSGSTEDPWQKSEYRYNEFIAVQLKRRINKSDEDDADNSSKSHSSIWIGNYHMPCAFRDPAVMTIHCDLVAQRIQSLASPSSPFILAGDFNIMPDSAQYHFLTTGKIDETKENIEIGSPARPPIKYGVKWESNVSKMKSAYALYNNGQESDFTNFAHNGAISEESFIGTLDYIFLSDEHKWVVKDVQALKNRNEVNDGPFPNADEPSDHVLIAATLEV